MLRIHDGPRTTAHAAALLLVAALAPIAAAKEPPPGRPVPDDLGPGTGCLQTIVDGQTFDFPLKHTKVDAQVSGPVARVEVTQTFRNPYAETIEATYVFPLPHDAAVCDFRMKIGDRVIMGLIEKRDEARRIYEEARASGHVASLLEQERPNIFTQSVANILPGREIDVTITYVETLPYEKGAWELAFPTVVGPRFNPPGAGGPGDVVPAGFRRGDDDDLKPPPPTFGLGSAPPEPPFLPPGMRSGHDIAITVDWDAGIPIAALESPTHRVDVTRRGTRAAAVALHSLDSIPNKDFVLRCRAQGDGPSTGVLSYNDGRDGYLAVLLHPKLDLGARDTTPKEMIFVLDSSGSMSGEPIAAAKAVVRHALTHMNPDETFQMINFSSTTSSLGSAPVAATPENVKRGLAYLERLEGEGGTMMIEGIKAALDFPHDPRRLRVVMFLTDGYIGNESEILAAVRVKVGDARLYSFGVGSSVNRYLLDGLALEGRGEVHYVLPGTSAMEAAEVFAESVRRPYLTDIEMEWKGIRPDDVTPARTPDLFAGKPLVVYAHYNDGGDASLEVRGKIGGRPWSQRLPLDLPRKAAGNSAIGALWARARIGDLERDAHTGMTSAIEDDITQLGLAHHLVTQFTSFVAVEEKTVVSNGRPTQVRVPVEMPQGVSYEKTVLEKEGATMNVGIPLHAGGQMSLGGSAPMSQIEVKSMTKNRAITTTREGDASQNGLVLPKAAEPARDASRREDAAGDAKGGSLRLILSSDVTSVEAGASLSLTLTIENASSDAIDVPKDLRLADGLLRLRVRDARGAETQIGPPPAGSPVMMEVAMVSLPAGKRRTYRIRLTAADAAFLKSVGSFTITLRGGPLGTAGDSNAVTIRVK